MEKNMAEYPHGDPNYISLKEYFDAIMTAHDTSHVREHQLLAQALERAETVVEARLEGLNGSRALLLSQASTFISKDEFDDKNAAITARRDAQIEGMQTQLNKLDNWRSNMDGRFWALGVGLTILTTVLTLALHFFKF